MNPDQQPNFFGPPPTPQPPAPQPPQPSPTPYTYLDQIAPQAPPPKRLPSGPMKFIILGLIAVVAVIILAISVNIISNANRGPAEQLGARLTTTQAIAEGAQPKLRNSQLRSLNSNLRLSLTNTNRDIAPQLATLNVQISDLNPQVLTREQATQQSIERRLEDARLNAVFDRTYAREMAFQLETLLALIQQIYTSTNNAQLRDFLETTYNNLRPTQEGFAQFSELN